MDGGLTSYSGLAVELINLQNRTVRERTDVLSDGSFLFREIPDGDYEVRVTTLYDVEIAVTVASVGPMLLPLEIRLPQNKLQKPVSGTVSFRELNHPLSKQVKKLLESGKKSIDDEHWDDAAARFRQAAREAPDCAQAHADLGLALSKMRQWDDAAHEYRTAIALEPKSSLLHSNLGAMLAASQHFEEAERESAEALKLDLRNVRAHYVLAGIFLQRNAPLEEVLPHLLAAREAIPSARIAVAKICGAAAVKGCPR